MQEKALIDQIWLVYCCKCLQWASFKMWINQLLHLAPKILSKQGEVKEFVWAWEVTKGRELLYSVYLKKESALNHGAGVIFCW